MKIQVQYKDKEYTIEVDKNEALLEQMDKICTAFGEPNAEYFELKDRKTKKKLSLFEDLTSYPENIQLDLVRNTSYRALESIERLGSAKEDVKLMCYQLGNLLKDPEFAEEFIQQGGIDALIDIVSSSDGNTQSYALNAVVSVMGYVNGLETVLSAPDLVAKLFALLKSPQLNVIRNALDLLLVIGNISQDFYLLNSAAERMAKLTSEKPYTDVVELVKTGGDLEATLNAFTLLNVILVGCPDSATKKRLIRSWELMGLNKNLREKIAKINEQEFQAQLDIYENVTAIVIRSNNQKILAENERLKNELKLYQEQQPYVRALKDHVERLEDTLSSAVSSGTLPKKIVSLEGLPDVQSKVSGNSFYSTYVEEEDEMVVLTDKEKKSLRRKSKHLEKERTKSMKNVRGSKEVKKKDKKSKFVITRKLSAGALDRPSGGTEDGTTSSESEPSLRKEEPVDLKSSPPSKVEKTGEKEEAKVNPVQVNKDIKASKEAEESETPTETTAPPPPPPGEGAPPPPPPPGGDGAPPPPPPPGGGGMMKPMGTPPNKPLVKPKAKMKPLYWSRIILPPKSEKPDRATTIWDFVEESNFDKRELERLFCKKEIKKKEPKKKEKKGKEVVTTLERKRFDAIMIGMKKLPTPKKLSQILVNLDQDRISLEQMLALEKLAPTPDEIAKIKEVAKDSSTMLDKADKFLLELDEIPNLKQVLKCWIFKIDFEEIRGTIETPLNQMHSACMQVRNSDSLKKILGLVLAIGNYMNGGTNRGQANGFQLEVLGKLTVTKDLEGSQNLLEYMVKIALPSFPELKQIVHELTQVRQAARVSLNDISVDLQQTMSLLKQCNTMSENIMKNTKSKNLGAFADVIPKFLQQAEHTMKHISKKFERYKEEYTKLLEYLGYPATKAKLIGTEVLFGTILEFATKVSNIAEKIDRVRKAAERKMKQQQGRGEKISKGDNPVAQIAQSIKTGKGMGYF